MGIQSSSNTLRNLKLGLFDGKNGGNPLEQGLVAYYTLNESSGVRFDCGPNNIDLDIFNTVGFTSDGVIDGAAEFSGVGRLTSETNTALDALVGEDFSYCGWFTLDTTGFSQSFMSIGDGNIAVGNENLSFLFFDVGSQSIIVAIPQGTSYTFLGWNIAGGTPTNSFMFLAVKYDASAKKLSLRINDLDFPASVTLPNQLAVASSPKVSFGALTNDGIPQDGLADETVIYDRILTDSEFDHYFRGGGILSSVICAYFFDPEAIGQDAGPNNIDLTIYDGVSPKNGIIGGAIGFNGREEGASSATHPAIDSLIENSFSITMWGRVDSVATESGIFLGILSGVDTGDLLISILYFEPAQGIVATIYFNGGANSQFVFLQIDGGVPKDTWFSIQVTFDEPTLTLRMRLNDEAFGSVVIGSTTNVNSGLQVALGSSLNFSSFLDGRVDEATVYSGVLSDRELNTRYMNGQPTRPFLPGRAPCAS